MRCCNWKRKQDVKVNNWTHICLFFWQPSSNLRTSSAVKPCTLVNSRTVSLWEQTTILRGIASYVAQYEPTRLQPMSPEVTCTLLQQNKHSWWESRGGLHGRHRRDINWGVNRQKWVQIRNDVIKNQKSRTCWNIANILTDKPRIMSRVVAASAEITN